MSAGCHVAQESQRGWSGSAAAVCVAWPGEKPQDYSDLSFSILGHQIATAEFCASASCFRISVLACVPLLTKGIQLIQFAPTLT